MAYTNVNDLKQLSFFTRAKIKIGKLLAKDFPYLKIRLLGLKLCGFEVGNSVYVGQDLIVASMISEKSCYLKIGDRVAIGPRVTIILASDANWSNLMKQIEPIRGIVVLENDCWIGAGSIILPNVTIGEYSIVGAGSVVTKDVKPYTVVIGAPAKFLKNVDRIK
jgi:acetyltransferase-like isoleucine patch superfamily enzyme